MNKHKPHPCESLALKNGTCTLAKLPPTQCCSVKIPFQPIKPGRYTIQASFTYNEGTLEPIKINTIVDSTLELTLNIGVVMFAYVLTRLSLNFTTR